MKIEITVSDSNARFWLYCLRKKYSKKRASLESLARLAVMKEVNEQANLDAVEALKKIDNP